jgi:aminoglycoside phosphotransferase (APT) family kinase protein
LDELSVVGEDGSENASVKRGMGLTLRFLEARERGGRGQINARMLSLARLLSEFLALDASGTGRAQALQQRLEALAADSHASLVDTERTFDGLLHEMEKLAASGFLSGVSATVAAGLSNALARWETGELASQIADAGDDVSGPSVALWRPLQAAGVQLYLRERFDEANLSVTDFKPLSGGFGKETVLITVQGRQLCGDFVIRRDRAVNLVENDCHQVKAEYELLCAVHARGFPTPKALWLQLEHPLLPGADFIVMERVRGVTGGSVFGTNQQVDPAVSSLLGKIVGELHSLPPLVELGNLTDSIRPELWNMSLRECVVEYISNYLKLMLNSDHMPSVTAASQFNWLLQNVPDFAGRPCLLHGDIGLHNMLLEDGRLNALFDWEFAHIGDPAEDLAYIRNTMGASLNWRLFMESYIQHGGQIIEEKRIRFFQIWGQVRNAAGGTIFFGKFANGQLKDPMMMLSPYEYGPRYLLEAQALIDDWQG